MHLGPGENPGLGPGDRFLVDFSPKFVCKKCAHFVHKTGSILASLRTSRKKWCAKTVRADAFFDPFFDPLFRPHFRPPFCTQNPPPPGGGGRTPLELGIRPPGHPPEREKGPPDQGGVPPHPRRGQIWSSRTSCTTCGCASIGMDTLHPYV